VFEMAAPIQSPAKCVDGFEQRTATHQLKKNFHVAQNMFRSIGAFVAEEGSHLQRNL
jgi:hypothetical protein